MGLLVTATEAAFLCGCSDRTIRRMIEQERLTPHEAQGPRRTRPASNDHPSRVGPSHWLIDVEDLAGVGLAIIEDRRRELEVRKASPARVKELETENAQLRAKVARLEERIRILTRYDGRETGNGVSTILQPISHPQAGSLHPESVTAMEPALRSRPTSRSSSYQRKSRRITDTPDLPSHLFPVAQLAVAHGVSENTITKQWKTGKFQVTGPYKVGRNAKVWAADRENVLRVLRYWFFDSPAKTLDPSLMGNCLMPNCPCGELREEKS